MVFRARFRGLGAFVALAVWAPATVFFATVGLLVARQVIGQRRGPAAPIADLKGALVSVAFCLGGAVVGLGLAWLVLPSARRLALRWSAGLWLAATALMLGTRRVEGWPLLLAAGVATGIGLDVCRRLVLTLVRAWNDTPTSRYGVRSSGPEAP